MGIEHEYTQGKLSWTTAFEYPAENADISVPVDGRLAVELEGDVQYPVHVGIQAKENDYEPVDFVEDQKTIDSSSDIPVEFRFENTSGKKRPETGMEIWFSDDGDKGNNYPCPFRSAEVVNLCCRILSESDFDAIVTDIEESYDTTSIAHSDFRRDARYCTNFEQYIQILDFLYGYDDSEYDINEETLNFIRNRVIERSPEVGGKGIYKADSMSNFEDKIELCSSKPNLANITACDDTLNELRGNQREIFAKQAVRDGDFETAKQILSEAIKHFEQASREEVAQPTILKKQAVEGLLAESNSRFETAAEHYSNAAKEAGSAKDERIYQVWTQLCEVKHQLVKGQLDEAQQSIRSLEESFDDVDLVDLRKLTILVELLEDYQNNNRSDAYEIFDQTHAETQPQEAVLQYNTDYSTAYTMLLTRQRHNQLNIDPGFDKPFQVSLKDALTPTGIAGDQESTETTPTKSVTRGDNSTEVVEREYTEIQRPQRDITFSEDVKQVYDETCAVCGSQRRTPNGQPEVEAAHIRPVEKEGPDIVENGVALCRLHHWAFDNGWLSIDDDYEILVQESPNVTGYEDFVQFEGEEIILPESEEYYPRPDLLRFHRQKHDFE